MTWPTSLSWYEAKLVLKPKRHSFNQPRYLQGCSRQYKASGGHDGIWGTQMSTIRGSRKGRCCIGAEATSEWWPENMKNFLLFTSSSPTNLYHLQLYYYVFHRYDKTPEAGYWKRQVTEFTVLEARSLRLNSPIDWVSEHNLLANVIIMTESMAYW